MKYNGILIGSALIGLIFSSAPACAGMNDSRIKSFIDETTRMSNPDNGLTDQQINAYLQEHLSDTGVYKGTVTFNIAGYPPQTKEITLDKEGYIKNVLMGRATMQDYTSSVTVDKIKVHDWGKEADVIINTSESGKTLMQDQMVPFNGTSTCNQTLTMEKDTITIATANCRTTLNLVEEETF